MARFFTGQSTRHLRLRLPHMVGQRRNIENSQSNVKYVSRLCDNVSPIHVRLSAWTARNVWSGVLATGNPDMKLVLV